MYKDRTNMTFGDMAIAGRNRNEFLKKVNELIDWNPIEKLLKKHLKRGANAIGNPAYSELLLFKILLLQTWYNLSDPKVEEAIYDRVSFMLFLNLSTDSSVPDYSTICRFRNSLIPKNIDKKLFLEINEQLTKQGIMVQNGAVVDATIISSSRRPRKDDELITEDRKEAETSEINTESRIETTYSKDKEARWIKKCGKYFYGYKVHNAVNKEGYILGGVITGANAADISHLEDVLNELELPEGLPVLADKGYPSEYNKNAVESRGLVDKIMRKATKSRKLTEEDHIFNKEISRYRYVVEQTFGLLKLHFGFTKMRYISKRKATLEYYLKSLSFNLKKASLSQ